MKKKSVVISSILVVASIIVIVSFVYEPIDKRAIRGTFIGKVQLTPGEYRILAGSIGEVTDCLGNNAWGVVKVNGKSYDAIFGDHIPAGKKVVVASVSGTNGKDNEWIVFDLTCRLYEEK